jgi:phosphoribosyl 1,2-cyclic phosphate phosphodiesterase
MHIVVDTPPDFREQVLEYKIRQIDAVLFTHSHADHIFGFDDIRRFNTIQECLIPAYASPETLADLKRIFSYAEQEAIHGLYRPQVEFREITEPFNVGGIKVESLAVPHGPISALGFIFSAEGRRFGYFPDCMEMSDNAIKRLGNLDVMILDALKHHPHKTHMSVSESVKALKKINAKQSYLIHMCHELDHEETETNIPDNMFVSYDGLEIVL